MLFTKFRLGALLGFAVGYVLGARAGRERYQQIMTQWTKARRSDPGQTIEHEVRTAAERAGDAAESTLDEQVRNVTQTVKEKVGRSGGEPAGGEPAGRTATTPADGTIPPPSIPPPPVTT